MFSNYKDVLTPAQLAEALGIGVNSTYKLLREGTIRSLRVGKKYIIPKVCLIDYVQSARYNNNVAG